MAGISILRRLLMKEAVIKNAPFQNEGIMSISKALATNIDSKVNKIVEGAKRQGIDFDKYNEQEVKYILELNKKKLEPRVISADSPEGRGITEALLGRKEGKVIKADFGKPFAKEVESMQDIADARLIKDMYRTAGPRNLDEDAGYLAEFIAEDAGKIFDDLPAEQQRAFRLRARKALRKNVEKYKKFPTAKDPDFEDVGPFDNDAEKLAEIKMSNEGFVDDIISEVNDMETISAMKEVNKVIKREGKYKNLTDEDVDKIFKGTEDRTAGRLDDIDPQDMATGGRVGLKTGMSKRAFLKLMGGAAAGIGALKTGALKLFGKEGAKKVATDIVTTPPVPGKPAWFDSLVNKVIREGEDVTAKMSIKEREIVHQLSLEGKMSKDALGLEDVRVTQDLDEGTIRVQYNSPNNMGEDTVELVFKKGETTEEGAKVADEFYAVEKEPRAVGGPEDVDLEFDGENVVRNVDELQSDTLALKQAATGEKPTMKEFIQSKNKKDKVKRINEDQVEQAELLEEKYGPYERYMSEDDNFASGGRVGLFKGGGLKGGGLLRVILQNLAEQYGKKPSELLAVTNYKSLPAEVRKFLTKEQFQAIKKDMQEMRIEQFKNLRDMVENRQQFDKSREALKKMGLNISDTILQAETKAPVPGGTTPDDLLMMEQIIKNLQMKDRKLNASGGLAGMLGE